MTTIADAALADIIANPDSDTPRLMYADWLEEHGDPDRAAFIRVQCEIARLESVKVDRFNDETDWSECTGIAASWCPNCGDCCCRNREQSMSDDDCSLHNPSSLHCCLDDINDELERLREREQELFNWDWLPDFNQQLREWYYSNYPRDYQQDRPFSYLVRRGFVEEARMSLADWQQHGPEIVKRQPVARVVLTDKRPVDIAPTNHGWAWLWMFDPEEGYDPHLLPSELLDALESERRSDEKGMSGKITYSWAIYDTEADAINSLSAALLRLAKGEI